MTSNVVQIRHKRQECRCAACARAAHRFPNDPPQLLLPLAEGGFVSLYSLKARA